MEIISSLGRLLHQDQLYIMIKNVLIFLLLLSCSITFGQKKYEKEYRIKKKTVPTEALEFVKALGFEKRIKWYKEEGLNKNSIEAKTKQHKKRYSIEFDTSGEIEDIEIKIKWRDVPTETQEMISKKFRTEHQKFKIQKIQIQYSGSKESLIKTITQNQPVEGIAIHYELVVKTKTNKDRQDFEYLFSEKGELKKKSVIVSKNSDHLEY